jgi:hypothetical protein
VACTRCRPAGRLLDASSRAELHGMARGEIPAALANPGLQRALLRVFLEMHLQQDRPLRSLELFLAELAGGGAASGGESVGEPGGESGGEPAPE